MTRYMTPFCKWANTEIRRTVGGQVPKAPGPAYVPCCKCLQFNQVCNSQYLGVA